MSTSQEILATVEPHYVNLPSGRIELNCGDGRGPVDESEPLYAKEFGGRPALAWNYMVLSELLEPGSIQESLPEVDASLAEEGAYDRAEINGGVHSDEAAEGEGATKIDLTRLIGKIGCGRWQLAEEISDAAKELIEEIIVYLKQYAPSAIDGLDEEARKLANINSDLAHREAANGQKILPSGREVVVSAINNGAHGVVLAGNHVEKPEVAYNLVESTTNDNKATQEHFGADGWINLQFFTKNKETMPFDSRLVVLQDAIMALATKQVLTGSMDGVAVRA